jgi:tetratricopeptide (TPR) repeat protein
MTNLSFTTQRNPDEDRRRVEDIRAVAATDLPRAIEMAKQSLLSGLEHPLLLNLMAAQCEEEGRFADALGLLDRAAALDPLDVYTWNAVGLCLIAQDRKRDAAGAFDHALSIDPDFPQANYNLANALESMADMEGAKRHYEHAVRVAPDYADAIAGLASLAVRAGQPEVARQHALQALSFAPMQPTALAALATLDIQDKNFAQAETQLRDLVNNPGWNKFNRPTVHCLLGDTLDGLGRTDEAFAEYQTGKALFRAAHAATYEQPGVETQRDLAERLKAYFEKAPAAPWSTPAPLAPEEPWPAIGQAFLIGFPRSGTTLLEHVLASHPDMVNVDERATLHEIEGDYLADEAALDRLSALTPEQAAIERAKYWARVRRFGIAPEGKIVIDKMPLYTVKLPIIAKLFPGVKILFAERDPRDVVLSCFRRPFQMNPGMYQFVTLDSAARYYDTVMSLFDTYRRKLPLDVHLIRYETLVRDFETETSAMCAFLGVDWSESMRGFAQRARDQQIRTPSASQVRSGLYTTGAGQWRRYARQLEPVMPILQPWIDRMGYDAD